MRVARGTPAAEKCRDSADCRHRPTLGRSPSEFYHGGRTRPHGGPRSRKKNSALRGRSFTHRAKRKNIFLLSCPPCGLCVSVVKALPASHGPSPNELGPRQLVHGVPSQAVLATDLLHQQRNDRLEMIVRQLLQFVIGAILHRMLHEHIRRIGAKRLRLRGGGIDELGGSDTDRRNSVGLEIRQVMRTARRAGASVRQPFDDDVHFAHDLLP